MNWPLVKLGELVDIKGGGTPSKQVEEYWNGDIPWASVKDFKGSLITKTQDYITREGVENSATNIIPAGTPIVPTRMALGKVALTGCDMAINQDVKALLIKDKNQMSTDYLLRFLENSSGFIEAQGQGATVKGIKLEVLRELAVPLPPLAEQKRIAAILDKADQLRQKRQQAMALADDFLRSVFLDMFGDPVTNPKGWETMKLGELSRIRRGASPRPIADFLGGTVPWIKIGDGSKGDQVYLHKTKESVSDAGAAKSVYLEPESLIFANCGVSLGFARILKFGGCIHDGWLAIDELDERVNKIFLLKWINQLTQYFRSIAPDGTQPNLNSQIMKNQDLILPPISLQNKYEKILHGHERLLDKLRFSSSELGVNFKAVSQKAFSGEL